jgi:hypothetical protein
LGGASLKRILVVLGIGVVAAVVLAIAMQSLGLAPAVTMGMPRHPRGDIVVL